MNTKNIKRIVLIASGVGGGLFIFLLVALLYNFCGLYRSVCKDIYTPIAYMFFSFPFLFLLSLLTYRLKDEVFLAWWNFAKWWVPTIIVVTLYLNSGSSGSGMEGAIQGGFVRLFIGSFYVIFIIVSFVKIVRAYLKTRGKE